MQTKNLATPDCQGAVVTESTRAYAIRTSILVGAIAAAVLVTANFWTARPEAVGAVATVGNTADTIARAAEADRSGSLAVYPLLY